jgi:hypothetical protein
MKDLTFTVSYTALVILVCCALHNFCKMHEKDTGAFDGPLGPEDFNIEHALLIWDSEVQSRATAVRIGEALFQAWKSGVIKS